MLHKSSSIISPATFQLIQELQAIIEFKHFILVDGTSLALQLGHRNSIDIDLFTQNDFTAEEISDAIGTKYSYTTTLSKKNTVLAVVNNIKTDFIRHNHPLLLPPVTEEGITFLNKEDIAAMKLHAIIQSGKRMKDFIDIYYLLEHFSMQQMIEFFSQKYSYTNPMIAMKAVNYFGDIDENIDLPKMITPLKLEQIKKRIQAASLKPNKTF